MEILCAQRVRGGRVPEHLSEPLANFEVHRRSVTAQAAPLAQPAQGGPRARGPIPVVSRVGRRRVLRLPRARVVGRGLRRSRRGRRRDFRLLRRARRGRGAVPRRRVAAVRRAARHRSFKRTATARLVENGPRRSAPDALNGLRGGSQHRRGARRAYSEARGYIRGRPKTERTKMRRPPTIERKSSLDGPTVFLGADRSAPPRGATRIFRGQPNARYKIDGHSAGTSSQRRASPTASRTAATRRTRARATSGGARARAPPRVWPRGGVWTRRRRASPRGPGSPRPRRRRARRRARRPARCSPSTGASRPRSPRARTRRTA